MAGAGAGRRVAGQPRPVVGLWGGRPAGSACVTARQRRRQERSPEKASTHACTTCASSMAASRWRTYKARPLSLRMPAASASSSSAYTPFASATPAAAVRGGGGGMGCVLPGSVAVATCGLAARQDASVARSGLQHTVAPGTLQAFFDDQHDDDVAEQHAARQAEAF